MKAQHELLEILNRISSREATDEDIHQYNRWCHSFQTKGLPIPDVEKITSGMLEEITKRIRRESKAYRLRLWSRVAAAACVILIVGLGGYYLIHKPRTEQIAKNKIENNVAPGGNKATLTLANGQTIILDSMHSGQIANQGNSKITKAGNGLLAYQAQGSKLKTQSEILFNTLTVPRGGQYQLILPDGTKVWLNAASSIRYPAAFTGRERKVAITGEVYMEVAKDVLHPFIVSTRKADITVLGTSFNIMAYPDESSVETTLLEGSVKVVPLSGKGEELGVRLKPGQQAIVANADGNIGVKTVNAGDVAAWIHGLLSLNDCSVQEFMDQLSRWYNVDIQYTGKIPDKKFGGMINRNAELSNVLAALDAAGIHTRLEGKKIIVLN